MRSRHPRHERCEPALMSIEGALENFGNGEEVRFALSLLRPGIAGRLSQDQARRLQAVECALDQVGSSEPSQPADAFRR